MVEAELALVAEVDDLLEVARRQLLDIAVDGVHVQPVEEDLERRAEREAAAAAAADVVDAPELRVDRRSVPELRRSEVQRAHDAGASDQATRRIAGRVGGPCETRVVRVA